MRVLFVSPHYPMPPTSVLLHPTLAYGYMAAELKRRFHEVAVLDLPMRTNSITDTTNYLLDYNPDVIGVTSVTQSYCQALEIARYCKQVLPAVPVVFGGPHVTFTPQETLQRHSCVDYVMLFDCDHSFSDLVDALAAHCGPSKVDGVAYRSGAHVVVNPPAAAAMDLDIYAKPDRSLFDLAAYLKHDYETVVVTARGCPSRCSFCSTTRMGRQYRYHSPARAVDEIEEVVNYGFSSIFFGDDTFPANPERTLAVCELIRNRGIHVNWTSNMRILDARPEVLEAMRSAGAYRVFTGIETIRADSLKTIKKGTTPDRIRKGVAAVKAAGLEIHTAFIIGVPGDTPQDLSATLEFIKDIRPTVATFNTMEVRPGTDMFLSPERYGLTIPDPLWYETTSWMNLPTCHTRELSQAEMKEWVERCYFEFCESAFINDLAFGSMAALGSDEHSIR